MGRALKAHQTTLRFTDELWAALQQAAAEHDVSVAQYVRDAARERLDRERGATPAGDPRHEAIHEAMVDAEDRSLSIAEGTAALWEQGRLARERSRLLREQARENAQRHRALPRLSHHAAAVEDAGGVVGGTVQQDRVVRGS